MKTLLAGVHGTLIHNRRISALAAVLTPLFVPGWHIVDIGCGDGQLAGLIRDQGNGFAVEGYDVLIRRHAAIPVHQFNGVRLPLPDHSVDAVMLVDVLHHTDDPMVLLREARRVARQAIVIKDHRMSRPFAGLTLRLMDWVANSAHGVALPYNYWPERRWREAWDELGLVVDEYQTRIGLYPWPVSWCFETGLHFIARLTIR